MNSDSFTLLADQQKTEVVRKATFLAGRLTSEHYIRLYNVDNFMLRYSSMDAYYQISRL
jgi:hypothetical protein